MRVETAVTHKEAKLPRMEGILYEELREPAGSPWKNAQMTESQQRVLGFVNHTVTGKVNDIGSGLVYACVY